MSDRRTDFHLSQAQAEVEDLAAKIQRQSCNSISYHTAYIQAVRLLGQT